MARIWASTGEPTVGNNLESIFGSWLWARVFRFEYWQLQHRGGKTGTMAAFKPEAYVDGAHWHRVLRVLTEMTLQKLDKVVKTSQPDQLR